MRFSSNPQAGNALWFVLLAVALLGFLTAIISRTSSSVDQTGSVEQARIKAAAILRYTQSIEAAVQQMVMNGTSENDLDFIAIGAPYDNPNCTTDDCNVFSMAGGGIAFRNAADVLGSKTFTENWHISGGNRVYQLGCDDANTSCTELMMVLPDIPQAVCLQINKIQDIQNPSGDAPRQNNVIITPEFTGTFTGTNANFIGGTNAANESPEATGKSAGCVFDFGTANSYVFYQVLLAR